MKEISTLGIDLAKNRFRVVGLNAAGKVVLRKWLYRSDVMGFMTQLSPCLVGMEACAGAHYWGREFVKLGHDVRLMPPQYVKPYVKRNKNDTNDAEACAEAATRPTMHFVPVKTEGQQALLQLHRVRERLVKVRTALGNEIRGFLAEFGIVLPVGINRLGCEVSEALSKYGEQLRGETSEVILRLRSELLRVEEEISFYERRIRQLHRQTPASVRLDSIPGIGEMVASAIVATVGNGSQFRNGRQFAAFLGLTPRQHSTGGKPRLGRISKRGDGYVRKLLVQGAQAVLKRVEKKTDPYSQWIKQLVERRGWCRAAVAVANKNARISWALLRRGEDFRAVAV